MNLILKLIVKIKSQLVKIRCRLNRAEVFQGPPPSRMAKETVLKKIAQVPVWCHTIELGYGLVTPGIQGGIDYPTGTINLLRNLKLPEDLKGKTVLDIGAWDGFFSFAAEKRGASRVLAIDNFYRGSDLEWTGSQGFETAKEILNSKVEFKKANVYDLNPQDFGMFDIVLFPGVFYHLKHPFLALEKIYSVCREMLIMETHYEPYYFKKARPLAHFYERSETNRDETTWWGFNEAGLLAVIRSTGFKNPQVLFRYADRIGVKAFK